MKYICTLISVKDMEESKRFYQDVIGLEVISDLGANVVLTGGIALQTIDTWRDFIANRDVTFENNAAELVFEEKDLDAYAEHLKKYDIAYVHPLMEHPWGQRVIRFYDPDRHIVEVGEDMGMVVKRFKDTGMTDEQAADRMGVPLAYIQECLEPVCLPLPKEGQERNHARG